jgi:hypothetical protein
MPDQHELAGDGAPADELAAKDIAVEVSGSNITRAAGTVVSSHAIEAEHGLHPWRALRRDPILSESFSARR